MAVMRSARNASVSASSTCLAISFVIKVLIAKTSHSVRQFIPMIQDTLLVVLL